MIAGQELESEVGLPFMRNPASLCRDPGQSEWPCVNTEPSIAFDLGDLGDLPREWS